MWDEQTGTVWTHLDGVALSGPLATRQLRILPLQTTTWGAWTAEHPATTVPRVETGYTYRQTRLGGSGLGRSFQETLPELDRRLPINELVIGVLAGSEARAFPIEATSNGAPMQDTVGGVPLAIFEDADGVPSLAYHRVLTDGRALDFVRREGALYDVQTGSRWSSRGLAVEGELAGVQLTFITSFFTEWYGWAAFHPETTIYVATGDDL